MTNPTYFTTNFPSQVAIAINPQHLTKVQSEAEAKMPNATAKHNYILNSLCVDAVSNWLEENIFEEDEDIAISNIEYLEACWSVVTGTEIALNSIKITVIPQDTSDIAGISIPREWVDIPQWMPDYYLAAQVDLEQKTIWLWGYVHSNTVKQQGTLDRTHQHYTLPLEKMSLDLELFGITHQLVKPPQQSPQSSSIARNMDKQEALEKLSASSPFSPRLDVPFEVWSALIGDRQWCQELYKQRCLNSQSKSSITKLLQWLKSEVTSTLDSGWKELNEILPASTHPPQLSYALRTDLRDMKDWVKKAKVIDLKVQLDRDSKIVLLIAITQKAENKYSIVAQLHPDTKQKFVPEAIGFQLIH
ncbi:MAG: DUF1822 family protein, partial [Waterburya sp.]